MPPQAHQLVKAVPRYGESQPHEKVDVKAHFENEPEPAVNAGIKRFRGGHNHRREKRETQHKTQSGYSQHEHLLHARRLLWHALHTINADGYHEKRSEERRVGKECRSRWSPE